MSDTRITEAIDFREGDDVMVLADGVYPCTPGVFIRLRKDASWAEIKERDGMVRSHPVVWLQRVYPDSRLLKRAF